MTQASQPLTTLQTRQQALHTQVTSFDTLASRIASLRSAADGLSTPDGRVDDVGHAPATAAVSVARTRAAATTGHYDVVVTELARAQVTVSTLDRPRRQHDRGGDWRHASRLAASPSASAVTRRCRVWPTPSTTRLASASTATVVRTGPTSYRLALTSTLSGAANAFTITNALTGGERRRLRRHATATASRATQPPTTRSRRPTRRILINNVAGHEHHEHLHRRGHGRAH